MPIRVFQTLQSHILFIKFTYNYICEYSYRKWIIKNFLKIYSNLFMIIKKVLLILLIQNDKNLLKEIGFSKNDIKLLNLEFKNILIEQNEDFLSYIKNQEESFIERILDK